LAFSAWARVTVRTRRKCTAPTATGTSSDPQLRRQLEQAVAGEVEILQPEPADIFVEAIR
jgi:hypothetical protein